MPFGAPVDLSGGFDPSLVLFSGYVFVGMMMLIFGALLLGCLTLPVFFFIIYACEIPLRAMSSTGLLLFKVVLILFRGLRRSPLRTSLTYLALFVLTFVLTGIYTIIVFIGRATSEKESNFKVIMTEKYSIPSMMPPGYEDRLKALIASMPPELQPVNGEDDIISWTFVGGTTDPSNPKPENALFMFCVEPRKITTMMDGLEKKDLTDQEFADMQTAIEKMEEDFRRIIVSKSRLQKMNLRVGQKIKLSGINYRDITFEFEIVGTLPDGKYEGVGFCNKRYLQAMLKSHENANNGQPHPMANKCLNLLWVRVQTREAYERLAEMVNDPKNFSSPAVKMETASAGIGSFMEAYKDIFFGMKYLMAPAMVAIMSLVIANAISISVRERRGELAVLKVLGFQPWHVMSLVLGEALLIGAIAGGMSTFLAWYMLGNFKIQVAFLGAFAVPSETLIYGPLLGMAVALAGSILPALSAKNVKVSEVFSKVA